MKKYIAVVKSNTENNWIEPVKELIMCEDCVHHRNRTGRCDVWSVNTPADGHCYRSERKEKCMR